MIKVGLTGGIGSGKSVVARIFTILGIPVFDADKEAKKIMETDRSLREVLITEFGPETYESDKLNRPHLARIVFNNAERLDKLNALVHPVTIKAANDWMQTKQTPYVVKEAALLFESGSSENLDYIIGVFAPVHVRIQRVIERDQLTREEVKARINRQIQDEIKMKLCDFILVNDEQHLLIPQVVELHRKLTELNDKLQNEKHNIEVLSTVQQ
jgi:dephospho-CoA kinase